ncbi:hypothetical protein B0E47_00560 [Rhodanobacter sp. B05]|nr:hypothetical protein B0E47_00560 [Rhodanobacter sp. B05]
MAKLRRNLSQMSWTGVGSATPEVVAAAAGTVVVDAGSGAAGTCDPCGGKLAQAASKADRVSGKARRSVLFIP